MQGTQAAGRVADALTTWSFALSAEMGLKRRHPDRYSHHPEDCRGP